MWISVISFENDFPEEKKRTLLEIFSYFGEIKEEEERYIDTLTTIIWSGPAYNLTVV